MLFKSSLELAKLHHSLRISEIIEKKIKNKNLDDNSLAMAFSSLWAANTYHDVENTAITGTPALSGANTKWVWKLGCALFH